MVWRVAHPAPLSAILEIAPPREFQRKQVLWQVRLHRSLAIYRDNEVLAVAMFREKSCRRLELALCISPKAKPHMLALCRFAHLTLSQFAHDRLVFATIRAENRAGQRMARLAGFRPSKVRNHWIWR